jgi:hypothetical protein
MLSAVAMCSTCAIRSRRHTCPTPERAAEGARFGKTCEKGNLGRRRAANREMPYRELSAHVVKQVLVRRAFGAQRPLDAPGAHRKLGRYIVKCRCDALHPLAQETDDASADRSEWVQFVDDAVRVSLEHFQEFGVRCTYGSIEVTRRERQEILGGVELHVPAKYSQVLGDVRWRAMAKGDFLRLDGVPREVPQRNRDSGAHSLDRVAGRAGQVVVEPVERVKATQRPFALAGHAHAQAIVENRRIAREPVKDVRRGPATQYDIAKDVQRAGVVRLAHVEAHMRILDTTLGLLEEAFHARPGYALIRLSQLRDIQVESSGHVLDNHAAAPEVIEHVRHD